LLCISVDNLNHQVDCRDLGYLLPVGTANKLERSDIDQSLTEIFRVLRPNGILILNDIYRKNKKIEPDLPNPRSCSSQALPLDKVLDDRKTPYEKVY
jgi:hypothetical protein